MSFYNFDIDAEHYAKSDYYDSKMIQADDNRTDFLKIINTTHIIVIIMIVYLNLLRIAHSIAL